MGRFCLFYPNVSGYSFLNNNPLRFIDPTGKDVTLYGEDAQNAFRELQARYGNGGNDKWKYTGNLIVVFGEGEKQGKVNEVYEGTGWNIIIAYSLPDAKQKIAEYIKAFGSKVNNLVLAHHGNSGLLRIPNVGNNAMTMEDGSKPSFVDFTEKDFDIGSNNAKLVREITDMVNGDGNCVFAFCSVANDATFVGAAAMYLNASDREIPINLYFNNDYTTIINRLGVSKSRYYVPLGVGLTNPNSYLNSQKLDNNGKLFGWTKATVNGYNIPILISIKNVILDRNGSIQDVE